METVTLDGMSHARCPTDRLHISNSHLTRSRVFFFSIVFSIPMVLDLAYVEVTHLGPHPVNNPIWFWGVIIAISAGFGILAAIGFSSDIAGEIDADDRGVRVRFATKEKVYAWSDIRPTGLVFPGSVRFAYSGGFQPFFASLEMTRELVAFQFAPNWSLPEDVDRRLRRFGDGSDRAVVRS
jgi:hypothetical protein